MSPLLLLAALGCAAGPAPETLVDELRVLAVLADPPEARPGEAVAVDSLVVDPAGEGYALWAWTCTRLGPDCLEDQGEAWEGLLVEDDAAGPWHGGTWTLAPALGAVASAAPAPLVQHWTLACAPGVCPEPRPADLADPFTWLEGLPMAGVSLGLRSLLVSSRAEDARRTNPTVTCRPAAGEVGEPLVAAPGERLPLWCAVAGDFDGDAAIWGYTTAGGFEGQSQELDPGDTDKAYPYIAPDDGRTGEVPVWVVITDGRGGVGLWEGSVRVAGG